MDRYWDPRSRTSFRFDHLSLVRPPLTASAALVLIHPRNIQETSDPEHVEPDPESEPFR